MDYTDQFESNDRSRNTKSIDVDIIGLVASRVADEVCRRQGSNAESLKPRLLTVAQAATYLGRKRGRHTPHGKQWQDPPGPWRQENFHRHSRSGRVDRNEQGKRRGRLTAPRRPILAERRTSVRSGGPDGCKAKRPWKCLPAEETNERRHDGGAPQMVDQVLPQR